MTSIEGNGSPRKAATRPQVIAVLAAVMLVVSAVLRQYREITIALALVLAVWAIYGYMQGRRPA